MQADSAPPRSQATSRRPALLGLSKEVISETDFLISEIFKPKIEVNGWLDQTKMHATHIFNNKSIKGYRFYGVLLYRFLQIDRLPNKTDR